MISSTPPAEIEISQALVTGLIQRQFPEFSSQNIRLLGAGWDNENYRLGDQYLIRLPRRAIAVPLLEHEIACLPHLPDDLPIGLPKPLRVGAPDETFPWPWTIIPWFDGCNAAHALPMPSEALRLADFLRKLHDVPDTDFAPHNPHRSEPLMLRNEAIQIRMERLKSKSPLITPHIEMLWQRAIDTTPAAVKSLLHGDLHAGNMVIHQNRIEALIDWGDICTGDVAVDLASFWMLFPDGQVRREALAAYGADDDMIHRAIGWAVYYGVVLLDTGWENNPEHRLVGSRLLAWLSEEL